MILTRHLGETASTSLVQYSHRIPKPVLADLHVQYDTKSALECVSCALTAVKKESPFSIPWFVSYIEHCVLQCITLLIDQVFGKFDDRRYHIFWGLPFSCQLSKWNLKAPFSKFFYFSWPVESEAIRKFFKGCCKLVKNFAHWQWYGAQYSIFYQGPYFFNSLTSEITNSSSVASFRKKKLKKSIINNY